MKKKLCSIICALLAALMLVSCAASPVEAMRGLIEYDAPSGLRGGDEADIPRFDDMDYIRPDTGALEAAADAVGTALSAGAALDDVTALLDECYNEYYNFSTMYTLAEIRYLRDLTDEYYGAEYSWCGENWSVVQQQMERMYTLCATSELAAELEREYFWEGFTADYGEGSAQMYTERAVALMQRESELLNAYYDLTAQPQIVLDGESVDYESYLSGADADEYARAVNEYYRQYNARFAGIYIDLIRTRRAIAEEMGYESYEAMQYASYERSYTPAEAAEFVAGVREKLVPLYEELMALDPGGNIIYSYMSERRLMKTVGAAAESIGGDVREAFEFMRAHGLYSLEQSDTKASMSFTAYLDSYDAPFVFVSPYCDTEDILTLAHEFGHFLDSYYNYNAYESLDLSEFFSQSMEYIVMGRLSDVLDGEELSMLRRIKLVSTLDTYVMQSSFAEFEQRVYALPDEELSAEAINAISLDTAKEFGYYDGVSEDYYAMSWADITHFFESPFYVISYVVSSDAAQQIYALDCENAGAGLEKYLEMLPREYETLLDTLAAAGLESPFAPGRLDAVERQLRAELDASGLAG